MAATKTMAESTAEPIQCQPRPRKRYINHTARKGKTARLAGLASAFSAQSTPYKIQVRRRVAGVSLSVMKSPSVSRSAASEVTQMRPAEKWIAYGKKIQAQALHFATRCPKKVSAMPNTAMQVSAEKALFSARMTRAEAEL